MRTRERGNGSSAGTGVRSAMPWGCPHRSPSEPPRPRRAFGGPTHHRKRLFGGRRLTLTLGQAVAWSPSRRGGAMSWTVGELARLAGVTVRTLHHYDRIGLVRPSDRTAAGYRSYDVRDLDRLQQVLVYRELGFPLEEVATLLDDPDADPAAHLRRQHRLLRDRLDRTQAMVEAVEKEMEAQQMGISLTPEERFELFGEGFSEDYEREAEERWGDTEAWAQSQRRTAAYGKEDWVRIKEEGEAIERRFAEALQGGVPADSEQAMDL